MNIDFDKGSGLVPAICQHHLTNEVLMLGYMNREALERTRDEGKVTFYSRSRQCLWTKGETTGHFMLVRHISIDCDGDTLLIKVDPVGPVCHTGTDTCFGDTEGHGFIYKLEEVIQKRRDEPTEGSYTSSLFAKGINKIAQKVGEEAVELVIEAKDDNAELFVNEAADLMYHYIILLAAKGFSLSDVERVLRSRHS